MLFRSGTDSESSRSSSLLISNSQKALSNLTEESQILNWSIAGSEKESREGPSILELELSKTSKLVLSSTNGNSSDSAESAGQGPSLVKTENEVAIVVGDVGLEVNLGSKLLLWLCLLEDKLESGSESAGQGWLVVEDKTKVQ